MIHVIVNMEIQKKSLRKTSQIRWHGAKKTIFPKGVLRFLTTASLFRRMLLSVLRAQREESTGLVIHKSVCETPSTSTRNNQTSKKYPPFFLVQILLSASLLMLLQLLGRKRSMTLFVNHVCMSKEGNFCQAESECPLLVRLRPVNLSKRGVRRELNCSGGTIF